MSRPRVAPNVSNSHPRAFAREADAERLAGPGCGQELHDTGHLTGTIDTSRIADRSKATGVASVNDVGAFGAALA
jgi:hypothetical protein